MRKAKVNDIVRSFTYAVRKADPAWTFPILGPNWENAMRPLRADCLVPFTSWAYSMTRNYLLANRHIVLLASYLRDLSEEEQVYAAGLMFRYYLPGATTNVCL